jgi:hypothetical protein
VTRIGCGERPRVYGCTAQSTVHRPYPYRLRVSPARIASMCVALPYIGAAGMILGGASQWCLKRGVICPTVRPRGHTASRRSEERLARERWARMDGVGCTVVVVKRTSTG